MTGSAVRLSGVGDPLPPGTLRVSALASRIQVAIKSAFPRRLWIVGETAELERSLQRPHWFFKLVEKEAEDGKRYALGAVIWSMDQRRLFGPGSPLTGVLEPKDGIEIRALVDVDFYGPNGDLRLVVREIDPTYTLGKMAIERQQLIERLTREGVLLIQKRLPLDPVPLHVGLITAVGSAAYNDFTVEITRHGFAFRVSCFDARMQGGETVRTVAKGIAVLAKQGVAAIAIVRGGGSTVDLAWFDKEELVRAIAQCGVPVVTGIGHEIDVSIADLAAHLSFKTPTAVAAFFNERAMDALGQLREARRRLAEIALRPGEDLVRLGRDARRLADLVKASVREQAMRLRGSSATLRACPPRAIVLASERARSTVRRLLAATGVAIVAPERSVALCAQRMRSLPLHDRVAASGEALLRARREIGRAAAHSIRRQDESLTHAEARVRLLDPANVLKRGFALLRDRSGKTIKDAARLFSGDRFKATLRDGEVLARVERAPEHGDDDGKTKERSDGDGPRQLAIW